MWLQTLEFTAIFFNPPQDSLGFAEDLFDKVAKGLKEAEEDYVEKGFGSKDSEYIYFGIDDTGQHVMGNFEPCLGVFEVLLSQEQYQRLTKTLLEITREVQKEDKKKAVKPCTVMIAAFAPTLS